MRGFLTAVPYVAIVLLTFAGLAAVSTAGRVARERDDARQAVSALAEAYAVCEGQRGSTVWCADRKISVSCEEGTVKFLEVKP